MATQATKQYLLETGAQPETIRALMNQIASTHSIEERIRLCYGSCLLLCNDAEEREEHNDRVTVREALKVLRMTIEEPTPMDSDEEEMDSVEEEEHFYFITELDDGSHELHYNDDLEMALVRAYITAKYWQKRWKEAVRGDKTYWRDVDGQTVQGAKKAGVLVTSDDGMDEDKKINLYGDPRVLRWGWCVLDQANHKPVVIPREGIQWLKPEDSDEAEPPPMEIPSTPEHTRKEELTIGENSEVTDKVLVAIAKDCIRHKWKRGAGLTDSHTFNSAEIKIYRAIEAKSTGYGFWGGYSFLDDEEDLRDGDELMGFIRVYRSSDGGSAKFSFWVKDGSLMLCHA